ncbi:putative iron-III ABC transporter periplasmic substrate-binding protein [Haloferax gibbonsii ATCC 33959]|uniref:Iron-III ABC transporter periplasmic substrate-binding protein n=1 Tax=Haloferax gibbonsii (strain ATCC 33959 / DSM 4427 / JCM 8863 / NBRC 102184 / NCIMB 2188 / Ma 2.38) TaxID=1227459 RepID=M0HJU2_HALGM|nr:helical backbone metal receptor [Haloferax gibbonsii]ELZ83369.1 putative iron-III ABC transporter periplasmic substrate-binding protein [Haloferax gibbonsii ATCC 33959]
MAAHPRVVSLAPSATAILDAAGLDAHVVGATAHSPTDKPVVGGWLNPDFDRVDELDADAVCTCDDLQSDVAAAARDRGYDVFHVAPATLAEVFDSFPVVCDAAGDASAGATLAEDCRDHLARVADAVDDRDRPTVYCEEWADPPMAAGNWVPDLVRAAGGSAPLVAPGERSAEVDPETVAAADPDHVVLHPCGKGERGDPEAFEARGWNLDAAVHAVDDSLLNQPSPAVVSGVDRLARLLHPDADFPEPWEPATATESDEGK